MKTSISIALACLTIPFLNCQAQSLFQLRLSGSSATSASVAPGGTLSLDVVAVSVSAEAGVDANLDSFTYRLIFPAPLFSLQNNVFAAPFDNALSPGGFNGSVPWAPPAVLINPPADAGSPGSPPGVSDLYRTTATTGGVPKTGPDILLETLTLQAPMAPGTYAITLNVLEAADSNGSLHGVNSGTDFIVTVAGLPPVITCPGNMTAPTAPGLCSAVVSFVPTATGSGVTIVCIPASGATFPLGPTTVNCTATDASAQTDSCSFTVTVNDNVPPTLSLNGANPITVECHTAFVDPGATVADLCPGVGPVTSSGAVDVNTPGSYTINYSATDANGNTGSASRMVNVVDTALPVITLNGANPLSIACHSTFSDPGATAADACAGSLAVSASGSVDPNTAGNYIITYHATDPSAHAATATRTVIVEPCPGGPALTCTADMTVASDDDSCSAHVTYPDPIVSGGVGAVTIVCTPATGSVFPAGPTTVHCTGTDTLAQTGSCSFQVTVSDMTAPMIVCPSDLTVTCLGAVPAPSFTGGSVSDNCDPSPSVTHLGDVPSGSNPTVIHRTYGAVDASGNTESCVQVITVQAMPGDLNGDCCVDLTDLNLLMTQIRAHSINLSYDLNSDGKVDIADARYLVLRFTNPGGTPCP